MRFIKEYNQFILEEVSKNEPIPEILNGDRGTAIFLIGAPGIGKCLKYNTPVLINDELVEIGKIIEDRNIDNIDGELLIPVNDLYINSLDDDSNIIKYKVSSLYRGVSENIINIKTQTGVDISVTPKHPLLILDKNGDIYWKNAGEINSNDKIARPRYINTDDLNSDISAEMARIIGYSLSDGNFVTKNNSKYLKLTNIDKDIIDDFKYCIEKESNGILSVKSNGYIHDVQFNDNIKIGHRKYNRYKYNFISNIENICGSYIFGNKSHSVEIPDRIFKNKELLKNFIGSYLGCDGSVYKNKIEIYTTSLKMANDLTYSLLKFGINSFIKEKKTKLNDKIFISYIIRITSDDYNLFGDIFNNYISCKRKKIKINKSTNSNIGSFIPNDYITDLVYENNLVKKIYNSLGYRFSKNLNYKRSLTKKRLEKIIYFIKENNIDVSFDKSLVNKHNNLFFDSITEISNKEHNDYVYDLVLDRYHNFIGGNIPTILHNSYFVKNQINSKNSTFKDFSTDDISLLYTKDPNVYYRGREKEEGGRTKNASQLNMAKMNQFMKTGQNFIYDTTGAGKEFTDKGFEHIKEIFDEAKTNGYKIIFIHLLSTLQTSIEQDRLRDRHVDPHYIQWAYAKQQGGEVDGVKVEGNIQRYKALNPDSYYLVTSIDKKYKFYKFIDGKLAVRKNDRYVIKESVENKSEVSNIVDCMLDMIEDGYNIMFKSPIGNMTYQQYLEGGGDFHPVFKPNEALLRSQFTIRIGSSAEKFKTYDDFVKIIDEMQVVIARLSDYDWILSHFEVDSYEGTYQNSVEPKPMFRAVEYKFVRQDQKLEVERKFDLEAFKTYFYNHSGMNVEEVKDYDDRVYVEFSSNYYDGHFPDDLDNRFSKICDRWGFVEYDYAGGSTDVSFYWDEV